MKRVGTPDRTMHTSEATLGKRTGHITGVVRLPQVRDGDMAAEDFHARLAKRAGSLGQGRDAQRGGPGHTKELIRPGVGSATRCPTQHI